jgi:hypothetical protein
MYLQYMVVYLKLPSRSVQPIILCLADCLDIPLRFVLSANIYLPCNWFFPGSSPTSTNSNTHNRLLSWSSWDHLRSTRWQPGPPNAGASCTFDFCLHFTIFSLLLIRIHWLHAKEGLCFLRLSSCIGCIFITHDIAPCRFYKPSLVLQFHPKNW